MAESSRLAVLELALDSPILIPVRQGRAVIARRDLTTSVLLFAVLFQPPGNWGSSNSHA